MRLTVQVQLLADADQRAALRATLALTTKRPTSVPRSPGSGAPSAPTTSSSSPNVATTSDGTRYAGKHLNRIRYRNQRLRAKLQRKGTKSAKRLLKQRCRKEARFAADTNHVISKRIVAEAERTGRGIALEDLQGIRGRVRLRKPQRATLHTWSFHQLGSFIGYKALRAGVVVIHVNPAHTSQSCSGCGHVDRANRQDQATFRCRSCGFAGHADWNAARNIAERGGAGWAAANQPHADGRLVARVASR
jgi:putative transposase